MKKLATSTLACFLVLPAISCAQERKPSTDDRTPARDEKLVDEGQQMKRADVEGLQAPDKKAALDDHAPRRLESVTWNSVKHELTWVISKGEKQGAAYKALANDNYEINMDSATMTYNGQTRRFSKEEAANVHVLMDLISKYAVDSTVWWDDGQGDPVNGKDGGKDAPKDKKVRPKPSDSEGIATLQVDYRPEAQDLNREIRNLEFRLQLLKQIQHLMDATQAARIMKY